MEHSLLHGLKICGLIFGLGGVLFRLLILSPALRKAASASVGLDQLVNVWTARAALAGAAGAAAGLLVQVAELESRTIYTGVNLAILFRYLTQTSVGQIALVEAVLLGFSALFARSKRPNSFILLLLLGGALVASTFVSHSAALPHGRVVAVVAQIVHIGAAAFWLGMLLFLGIAARHLSRTDPLLLSVVVERFSPFALVSASVIGLSGLYSAFRFIASPASILVSAYGLTLTLKLFLLGVVATAAVVNWRIIRPQLSSSTDAASRFLRLLEVELTAGVLLMFVAGVLGAISPPSDTGVAQLTNLQVQTLLVPRLPPADFVNPARFVGAAERTDDDLRYSEFSHQWSGIFVTLLALCWLGQSIRPHQKWFARIWPVLLIPFGVFIAIIADPEIWILRTYSFGEVLANPQVLEHQIGALMVLGLAALGFQDSRREPRLRPLGLAFPIVMVCGSLMLLGHAHSNLGVAEELSSLINVQHAIIGSFGLIAGLARWFQIRQLPGRAILRYVWPVSLACSGIFMAFFYREFTPPAKIISDSSYSMISRFRW